VYVQPPIPGPGYVWTPGYWAWDGSYYWVPGTWVLAPVGLLWTPGYWGWADDAYLWHAGYWGPTVGFYGGVAYGFGYTGVGFEGGYWRGDRLYYNRSVTNISNTSITNVYNRTVVNNVTENRVSFNGGPGGIAARPNAAQLAAEHEHHVFPLQMQTEHQRTAAHDNALRASVNGGRPSIAATSRPAVFSGPGLVAARGAELRGGAAQQSRGLPNGRSAEPRVGNFSPPRNSGNVAQERQFTPPRNTGNVAQQRQFTPPRNSGNVAQQRQFTPPRSGGGNVAQERAPAPPPHYAAAGRPDQGHSAERRGNDRPRDEERQH
jgi:hypothetical protein